jgi:hypothetical protein
MVGSKPRLPLWMSKADGEADHLEIVMPGAKEEK